MVLYTLLTHHLQNNDFGVVLLWLEQLLQEHSEDVVRGVSSARELLYRVFPNHWSGLGFLP